MINQDTIAAQATAPGRGGVGIIRVSGSLTKRVAEHIIGRCPKTRYADYVPFKSLSGEQLDQGIAIYFQGPNSFTGEDVLELQGHGGPVVLDMLLKEISHIFISKMLFGSGLLVQKKEFDGVLSVVEYVGDKLYRGAIVMLVDRSTSGAAEVLASAMQGRKQGIVIGERSRGVGKYKDVTPLNNGVLEVVSGQYMTLAGHAINDIGISPDVEFLFMKARVRHDAKSYVVALSKRSSFVRPSRQRQTALDAPLPYLRMKQKLRVDSSDSVPSYILMKRQEDNYASRRNIMDIHIHKQVYRKLLSAQAKLAKTGVRDVELFQGLQITQDWLSVKNAGMRSW